jgi:hypothetical protein
MLVLKLGDVLLFLQYFFQREQKAKHLTETENIAHGIFKHFYKKLLFIITIISLCSFTGVFSAFSPQERTSRTLKT